MSQTPMYPLSCDLHPDNRFDNGMALIHGPDHAAVATVVVQMEGDSSDRPDLLELAERMVLCYNAIPPHLVSTGALRKGAFDAKVAIERVCSANHREWMHGSEIESLREDLQTATGEAARYRGEAMLYKRLLHWGVCLVLGVSGFGLAVSGYPKVFSWLLDTISGVL